MRRATRWHMISQVDAFILPALVFMSGMQLLRTFIPSLVWYMRDTVGTPTLQLIPYAFGTFSLGFLAGLIRRVTSHRMSLWFTAGGVAVVRMVEQFSFNPAFDLWLSLAGLGLFLNFIPIYIGHVRALGDRAALRWIFGFIVGFSLDIALRGLFGARDLSTISGNLPALVIAILSGVILWYLWREPTPSSGLPIDASWSNAFTLLAFGPFLVVQVLFFSSHGYIEEVTGLSPPLGILIVMLGYASAAAGISWGVSRPHALHPSLAIGTTVYLSWATYRLDQAGLLLLATIVLAQFLMGWCSAVIALVNAKGESPGNGRTTVMVALSMLLFLILVFAFYVAQDIALPLPRRIFPAIASAIFGALTLFASARVRTMPMTAKKETSGFWVNLALLMVPLALWITQGSMPIPEEPLGDPIKVMTYNIHSGFNAAGRQDLEAIARVIEDSGADIVALQEVSRVRLLDGGADLAAWLSERLDMPYLFKGTEDPNWGNAILSRYPIVDWGWGSLPRVDTLIGRGYLWASIDVGASQPLLVIDTHLHHLEPDSGVRQEQVQVLLDFWAEEDYTIVLGDLNAEPNSTEIRMIADSGLLDAWSSIGIGPGFTFSSSDPNSRIDWIWHTSELQPIGIEVIQTQASDHMPVLASFEVKP